MRKPLNPHARRAGWVGCNILLSKIASLGKIVLVTGYQSLDANKVRSWYQSLKPIRSIKTEVRGWTLDMLQIVRRINKQEFSLSDAYSFEKELSKCHPDNSNIRPKIRQQLQVLRNLGWLQFQGRGRYRLLLPEGSNASLDQKMPQF
jgi:type II restriction enzyme